MFINPHLLSEPRLYTFLCDHLPDLLTGRAHLDLKRVKQIAYASWHKRNVQHIDQSFHSHWEHLLYRKDCEQSLCRALLGQVARYHLDTDDSRHVAVRMDRFDEWQSWLANQSGLPVIAFQAGAIRPSFLNSFEKRKWLKNQLGFRSIISPRHPLVEDYIECHGLNESHMHLNGTTTLESMWHFSLCNPDIILKDLESEFNKPRVQLLYTVNPEFDNPKKYEPLLHLARSLRQLLLAWVQNNPELATYKHATHELLMAKPLGKSSILNPYDFNVLGFTLEHHFFGDMDYWTHVSEIDLHISVSELLKQEPSEVYDSCYLLYLLCMNCFQRILVQRDDQIGFDQFQKFADDGIRETFEQEYAARFFQLHGPKAHGRPDLLTLEGRFAPKNEMSKNVQLLRSILRGFLTYAEDRDDLDHSIDLNELAKRVLNFQRPTLRLVAHFIKQPWRMADRLQNNDNQNSTYQEPHFYNLRQTLYRNSQLLFDLLESHTHLRQVLTGIDAAGNELESPPEIFAVLYRNSRRNGIQHYTYHVGEDFEHLLNGIRAVYEAIVFLELRNGDRLGHATAIGIDPQIWLGKMQDNLFLSRGQWLENLLFLRLIELEMPTHDSPLTHIEAKINQLSWDIFEESVDLDVLQQFFSNRDLEPEIVQAWIKNKPCYFVGWREEEFQRVKIVKNKQSLEYLEKRWFEPKTIERYETKVEIRLDFTPYKMLLKAQQYVQNLVAKRQIVLETLPTSNVRISHYQSLEEHHVFRWMKVPHRAIEGDYSMLVALGSDDPGIFVTDMRNEFYHLFSTLVSSYRYTETQALAEISKINENGRIYRFDGPMHIFDVEKRAFAEKW